MKMIILQWMMVLLHLNMMAVVVAQDFQPITNKPCFTKIPFDAVKYKPKYKIGVLATRGKEAAFSTYNATFTEYLSETAGQRFDPPIEFEMIDVDFEESEYYYGELISNKNPPVGEELDFLFVNPSQASCIASQFGTQPLASIVLSTTTAVDGEEVTLSEFAGLIITQADNENINTIIDLKNKTVAAISIFGFGSGLMQFYEMQKNGMSYINDPAQLVFTGDQGDVVRGVLDGTFDAGFVRTGMIEQTMDADGKLIDPSKIKIIESRQDLTASGAVFPYKHSTPLYPEWNFVATRTTPFEISREVQAALLSLARQGKTGKVVESCLVVVGGSTNSTNTTAQCSDLAVLDPEASCDTTIETAMAASKALSNGEYAGWRTSLTYNDVQEVLYETGNLKRDPISQEWVCLSSSSADNLYETVNCPTGFFKLSKEAFPTSCENAGFDCPEGSECICRPCFEALPVAVAPKGAYEIGKEGCKKLDICGTMVQNEIFDFVIADNLELGLDLRVIALEGHDEREINVFRPNPNQYTFSLSSARVGLIVLKIYNGEEEIDASPLRVQVVYRTCPSQQTASEDGTCRCVDTTYAILGSCVDMEIIWIAIFLAIMAIFVIFVLRHRRQKTRQADNHNWVVHSHELTYYIPLQVIGKGSFGPVLLAEYRGSKVAVKKALPKKKKKNTSRMSYVLEDDSTQPTQPMSFTGRNKNIDLDLEEGGSHHFRSLDFSDRRESFVRNGNDGSQEDLKKGEANNLDKLPWAKHSIWRGNGPASLAKMKREFVQEMRLVSRLRHPNITTIMGAVVEKGVQPLMVTEYMEYGSLQQVLSNPSIIMEAELIHSILKDIAQGLRFLHSSIPPVIHGNLKSGNVLIDSKMRAKLSEFGLSRRKAKEATGTPLWMAPELLKGRSWNTLKSDMYSVGIMMNEVFSRQEPYIEAIDESSQELITAITDGNRRPVVPSHCPVKAKKLLQFLWHADPKLRPSAIELDNRLREMDESIFEPFAEASRPKRLTENKGQGNSENFLYQAFPKHVADILAAGGKVEPESHEIVTIFFSDIVGFTKIAAQFEPLKVSQMLDRLYLKFDDLARKHELFKIETIGDAYMCAGNLATDQQSDHVKRIALFAKDAIKAASETLVDEEDPSVGCINIRVGFHSGPVVSNVVGNLNPRYGVFGDTVNVASRMESSSEVGKIHCSKRSAKLVKVQAPELSMQLRGRTAIKGKGIMTTYWIE